MSTPKRICLTGVTRGLGRALVDEFCRSGHTVCGCGRTSEKIKALRDTHPSPHRFDAVDVADADAVRDWAAAFLEEWGVPDLLINNAAIINPSAPLWQVDREDFSHLIDINIKGVFHVIQAVVPAMIAAGHGVIANLSSGWGRSTSPDVVPYCTSKWAIEGLSQGLAQELPPGLASVPVNPGIIDTEMLRSCFGDAASQHDQVEDWARRAAPFFLQLGPKDNGKPVSVPG